ncbi:MAG: hypothetical protein V4514_05600 [Pseudomonadota bacterium]|uniref:hypothetical protein n=1 Tax=unclassified Phenylobacterium TaxID=2640670 RepID=UPI0006F1E2D1|nr:MULTISPECIES: hypothetical protein [unclassified Phenylobacterium]KRB40945.1 hypothetical protein ASE02_06105 [Phenylobacterium sp. Root700]MBT9470228.1 hypothetical protein [Phenylobacterium sp.]
MTDEALGAVPSADGDDDLLTRAEASQFLLRFGVRMKPTTLARVWSTGGDGPPCIHVRRRPLYPRGVLRAWAERQSTGLRASARGTSGQEGSPQ